MLFKSIILNKIFKTSSPQTNITLKPIIKKLTPRKFPQNAIVLGSPGSGRATHPWDGLKECNCGGLPFMEGKDGIFETGYPYKVICNKCGKETVHGSVSDIWFEWNNKLNK